MELYTRQDRFVSLWLSLMCFAVVLMIFIGGMTRLTDSGLSMTDWKPVTGLMPPLDQDEWHIEFGKYKKSPEYVKINKGMSLAEFKSIYMWEYVHRMAGRTIVLLFLLPLIFFAVRGQIRKDDIKWYLLIGLLFLGQGGMGWYMVKSGLRDNPHVSHLRLSAHLILAMIIYSMLFWQKMRNSFDILLISSDQTLSSLTRFFWLALVITFLQIFAGGMVAGLDAGLVYNTYPLMGESFVPHEAASWQMGGAIFNDPIFVQFMHRMLAILVFVTIGLLARKCVKLDIPRLGEAASFMILAVTIQVSLGIITLMMSVPISYAIAHQLGAIFLVSSILWGLFLVRTA